ncbi:MAG TPA: SurA N-terminal domain-containing protein [Bacteroidia bacterium]|nr:SurA N-terminal domain-containing protein [Bacteroidia bacterium]
MSRIRSRIGLLVGIIFLALLAFVLTDLFNSQRGIFGGQSSGAVGEINGHSISLGEFRTRLDEASNGQQLNDQQQQQLSEAVWQELLDQYIYKPQYDDLGIAISDDELTEQMTSDHPSAYMQQFFQDRQSGQIMQQFQGPDGQLSGKAIRDFVAKMPAETEQQWVQIEKDMRKTLLREKYNNLLRKGFYVTTAEAKHEYADENTKYDFNFIVKKYSEIPDSTVKVTDDEMMDYYNQHQYKFKQTDNMRSMEYLAFDVYPSADDIADQRKDMENMVTEFQKQKTAADDSMFAVSMNESGTFDKKYLRPGQFPVGSDSAFLKAKNGDVLGPFNMGGNLDIYKVVGQDNSPDSAKVRHILIAYKGADRAGPEITRTKEQAKMRADSILKVVKSGRTKLEDLVWKLTDDPGSKDQNAKPDAPGYKGDYGWFTHESGFVQEFKDAGFNNPVGSTIVVETSFGYHVIQVLDRTKPTTKVQVIAIEKKVEPSEKTIRIVYNKASEFAGKNNTGDLFTAAVQKNSMQVLKADQIQENSRYISGIENARDIVRWMYDDKTEVGSVSQPFQSGDRYVVCHLTKIINKGVKPFDEVKDICQLEARKIKKGQMFTDQLNKAKGATLDAWAKNVGTTVMPAVNISFAAPYIQAAGYEGTVVGVASTLKPNTLSAPIKGSMGVYVVSLTKVTKADPLLDIAGEKAKVLQNNYSGRADGVANEVLKDDANVVDNRAKHF